MSHTLPYYGVIFASQKVANVPADYNLAMDKLLKMAESQPGFLGIECYDGVTISYWQSLAHIKQWKNEPYHKMIQEKAKQDWYTYYNAKIVKVEHEYSFNMAINE